MDKSTVSNNGDKERVPSSRLAVCPSRRLIGNICTLKKAPSGASCAAFGTPLDEGIAVFVEEGLGLLWIELGALVLILLHSSLVAYFKVNTGGASGSVVCSISCFPRYRSDRRFFRKKMMAVVSGGAALRRSTISPFLLVHLLAILIFNGLKLYFLLLNPRGAGSALNQLLRDFAVNNRLALF